MDQHGQHVEIERQGEIGAVAGHLVVAGVDPQVIKSDPVGHGQDFAVALESLVFVLEEDGCCGGSLAHGEDSGW